MLPVSAGNYDAYVRTRAEHEDAQMKKFKWEQDQISNMKEYIARFGHGSAKLARQAQSKEKTLDKMVRGGLTEKVQSDHVVRLRFTDVGKLPPPVLQFADVTFGYSPDRVLYRNVRPLLDLLLRIAKACADAQLNFLGCRQQCYSCSPDISCCSRVAAAELQVVCCPALMSAGVQRVTVSL